MKAIILAGGIGRRLQPYTLVLPKPLMPLGSSPVIEILLRQLAEHGFSEVIIAAGYLGHLMRAFCADGGRFGLRITYTEEEKPLGTAGPIALSLDNLGERFLVANGDLLTTLNFRELTQAATDRGADAMISAYRKEQRIEYGVLHTSEKGELLDYEEKPTQSFLVSMGVYVFKTEAVRPHLDAETRLDLPDLVMRMRAAGSRVLCFEQPCEWLDIGIEAEYQRAKERWADGAATFLQGEGG